MIVNLKKGVMENLFSLYAKAATQEKLTRIVASPV